MRFRRDGPRRECGLRTVQEDPKQKKKRTPWRQTQKLRHQVVNKKQNKKQRKRLEQAVHSLPKNNRPVHLANGRPSTTDFSVTLRSRFSKSQQLDANKRQRYLRAGVCGRFKSCAYQLRRALGLVHQRDGLPKPLPAVTFNMQAPRSPTMSAYETDGKEPKQPYEPVVNRPCAAERGSDREPETRRVGLSSVLSSADEQATRPSKRNDRLARIT